jgi:hypothetical protein
VPTHRGSVGELQPIRDARVTATEWSAAGLFLEPHGLDQQREHREQRAIDHRERMQDVSQSRVACQRLQLSGTLRDDRLESCGVEDAGRFGE